MTYENWCKHSGRILKEAEAHNTWRKEAQEVTLRDLAPRVGALGSKSYYGCGFHYAMEQEIGKLIGMLAIPWQPCANHCGKIEDDRAKALICKIIFEGLTTSIEEAEASVGIETPKTGPVKQELVDCLRNIVGYFMTPLVRQKINWTEDHQAIEKKSRELLEQAGYPS